MNQQLKKRLWLIHHFFAVLFGIALVCSMFGCSDSREAKMEFDQSINALEKSSHILALSCADLGYTCAEKGISREDMRQMIKVVLEKGEASTTIYMPEGETVTLVEMERLPCSSAPPYRFSPDAPLQIGRKP